jgi:O-antigen/teichoic acid export membrane protein
VLIVIFLTFRLLRGAGVTFRGERLKEMLKYSLPFVPAGIFSFILMWSDRYILQYYHGTDSVGMYALGYKMGMMVVFLVVTPFTLFWNSYIFEIQKRPDAGVFYSRIATYFISILLFVGLGISTFSYELITIMAPPSYLPAHTVIPLIVLAMVFMTSDTVFQVGLLIKGKSSKLPIAKGIAAILNILLNFLFVPSYGMIGSAWATAIAFFLYLVIILRVSQREYRIEFEYIRMVKIMFVTLMIFALSKLVPVESVMVSIGIKLGILSLFPVLLVLLGFLNQGEIELLRRSAGALRRRGV